MQAAADRAGDTFLERSPQDGDFGRQETVQRPGFLLQVFELKLILIEQAVV